MKRILILSLVLAASGGVRGWGHPNGAPTQSAEAGDSTGSEETREMVNNPNAFKPSDIAERFIS